MSKKMRITVISLLSVVFAVSVGFLVKDYCDSKMQAELYDNLIGTQRQSLLPLIPKRKQKAD